MRRIPGVRPRGETRARDVLLLAAAVSFVEALLFTTLAPLLPVFVEQFSISKAGAGLLSAAYPLGALAGSIPSILLARRAGLKRTVATSLVVLALASVAFALATTAWLVFAARFWQGVGSAFAYTGALAWLTVTVAPSRRAEAIGIAFSAAFVGALLGPLLGAAAETVGLRPVFLGTGAVVALLVVLTALLPAPRTGAENVPPLRRIFGDRGVLLSVWLIGLAGALLGIFGVLVPLHLDELGWTAISIGVLFAVASVITAVASPFVGRLADRAGREIPLQAGLVLAALAAAGLALSSAAWVYAGMAIAAAVAVGTLWAPAMAMLSDAVERRGFDQASGFGLTNAAWAPGFAVGAGLGAVLAGAFGDATALTLVASVCVATALLLGTQVARARVG
jgi:MFS family permease